MLVFPLFGSSFPFCNVLAVPIVPPSPPFSLDSTMPGLKLGIKQLLLHRTVVSPLPLLHPPLYLLSPDTPKSILLLPEKRLFW